MKNVSIRFESVPHNLTRTCVCARHFAYRVVIGLHHIAPTRLDPFVASIVRVLRPGGVFVLRDHDVTDLRMDRMVSLAHTVFNCGLGAPWSVNAKERRHFVSIDTWIARLAAHGLVHTGPRLAQENDPTKNLLLAFEKKPPLDLAFEAVSALSTVGLSTGITPTLGTSSKLLLSGLMLAGRVGLLGCVLAVTPRRRNGRHEYAREDVLVT